MLTYPFRHTGELFYVVLAESFYYVNYGSSIITSKVSQINVSNENLNTGVSVVFKTKRESKCQNMPTVF